MASLNWVQLADKTREPLPLPREKWLQSFDAVALSLCPSLPGAPLHDKPAPGPQSGERKATGRVFISNLRIVFVASPTPSPAATPPTTAPAPIETLSLPFQSLEGRFVQPIFHSNYFEALALPNPEGNLDDSPHTVRLSFKESGAFQFYEIYEQMKERLSTERVTQAESLRASAPPRPHYIQLTHRAATLALYSPPPPEDVPGSPLRSASTGHLPSEDDLQAATVARNAEEDERRVVAERETANAPPGYF